MYILGGYPVDTVGKDFFYLDVSVPFNTQNLLWQNLTRYNTVPSHYYATSVVVGANNTLLLYEGYDQTKPTSRLIGQSLGGVPLVLSEEAIIVFPYEFKKILRCNNGKSI